jgi:GH35 family endo-1,4-beta-xylanase
VKNYHKTTVKNYHKTTVKNYHKTTVKNYHKTTITLAKQGDFNYDSGDIHYEFFL